jgi:hypothetical protein
MEVCKTFKLQDQMVSGCSLFKWLSDVSPMNVGPCHHGMGRPQVANGGTASYMEGSCE